MLVAAVHVLDARDHGCPGRRKRGEDERRTGTKVGDAHLRATEWRGAGDASAPLVEDLDGRTHALELAKVIEAVLEDRLVDGGDAGGLRQEHGERRLEIGREAGVRIGPDIHRSELGAVAAADAEAGGVGIGFVGDADAIADPQEGAHVPGVDPVQRDLATRDRGGDGKGLRLQPVAQDPMLGAAQAIHALDLDPTLAGARDPRAHGCEHGDQVVDLRLECRVVDHRRSVGHGRREDHVLRAHDGDRRELDVRATQPAGRRGGEVVAIAIHDRCAHPLHGGDVEVHRTSADPVTTGVRQDDAAESRQHRPEQDEAGAHLQRGLERDERPLRIGRKDLERIAVGALHLEADIVHQVAQDGDVADLGDVAEDAALIGQDGRGHHLEHGVLGAGDADLAGERTPTGDDELLHGPMQSSPGRLPSTHAGRCGGHRTGRRGRPCAERAGTAACPPRRRSASCCRSSSAPRAPTCRDGRTSRTDTAS